jgi:hypothetical protein
LQRADLNASPSTDCGHTVVLGSALLFPASTLKDTATMLNRRTLLKAGGIVLAAPMILHSRRARACVPGDSFHVYPSMIQTFRPYDEGTPLACDTAEFDTTGGFCLNQHINGEPGYCFVAPVHGIYSFRGQVLWWDPLEGAALALKIMVDQLGTHAGLPGGEVTGFDSIAHQVPGSMHPITSSVFREVELKQNHVVWLVPVQASRGPASLAPAVDAYGENTCCFFEGQMLKLL